MGMNFLFASAIFFQFYAHINEELFLHAFLDLRGGEKQVC